MIRSMKPAVASAPAFNDTLVVRRKLARAMVGSTVDVLTDCRIAHGTVDDVSMVAGVPKIVVNGRLYDIDQVITSTTATASIH